MHCVGAGRDSILYIKIKSVHCIVGEGRGGKMGRSPGTADPTRVREGVGK